METRLLLITTNSVQDNIAKNEADKLKFKNDPGAYFGTK